MSVASQRVLDWLEGQSGVIFIKLYQQPSTALAIFRRMLPHLAKTMVMSMLFMPKPFALADLDAWCRTDSESLRAKDQSLSILMRLKVFEEAKDAKGRTGYRLSKSFTKSLRMALTGGGNHRSFGIPSTEPDKSEITVDFLDSYARTQWEAILYFVVGSVDSGMQAQVEVTDGSKQILSQGEFVKMRGSRPQITKKGFEFLLEETNAQIWTLLIEYLKLAEDLRMDSVEAISFLFTLGSLELGTSYDTTNLTATQKHMLDDLADFGIVYYRGPGSTKYYPTRLATTLTSDAPALPNSSLTATTVSAISGAAPSENEKGFIILETNYRMYAYTSSPLLIQIIALFASLKTRYPNMLTATLTKTSIQRAIAMGITSDQIISYLTTHAHPILRRNNPVLPPTVVDQIRLWQLEGERMKATPGFLIRDVGTSAEYERAVKHAETLGVLIWRDDAKGWFFVNRFEQVQQYFRAEALRKKELASGAGTPSGR
ncbi:putative TFIIH and nucleotide excision repair factor 3 complexes subunit [Myriangium duriaei CBS 260.36]|uniref:RNA polymerase II transcription factor B subunit 2 n=1 Tax=Myriangium duriaei CBS 260.36 TaxID=1168546 RepID=A0A9P4ML26_9PEZI|nr:putative TFIIH and nucleotide excision repair factor 3 complexes subunit [Myriangium duriaei CBS 260.36]